VEIERIQFLPKTLAQNCWILREKNAAIVIDPGCNAERILEILRNREKIGAILLTHHHSDHIRGVAKLVAETNAPVFIHPADAEVVENGWRTVGKIRKTKNPVGIPTRAIADGEILRFGKFEVEIIHTPGHTRGSVCFRIGGKIFSGDTLFRENVGRTDLAGGDAAELKMSLRKLLELPDETIVHPGHEESWTIGEARKFDFLF